jgi:hypothetical protein
MLRVKIEKLSEVAKTSVYEEEGKREDYQTTQ